MRQGPQLRAIHVRINTLLHVGLRFFLHTVLCVMTQIFHVQAGADVNDESHGSLVLPFRR